ncbi:MAG: sigma factor [Planctomycetota bacterium]
MSIPTNLSRPIPLPRRILFGCSLGMSLALRNHARLILRDWTAVDDVLQDASITMWESRQRLRDESGFLPWGKVIVRNKCFNAIAKMHPDRLVLDKDLLEMIAREEEYRGLEPRVRLENPNPDKVGGWAADEVTVS